LYKTFLFHANCFLFTADMRQTAEAVLKNFLVMSIAKSVTS